MCHWRRGDGEILRQGVLTARGVCHRERYRVGARGIVNM